MSYDYMLKVFFLKKMAKNLFRAWEREFKNLNAIYGTTFYSLHLFPFVT